MELSFMVLNSLTDRIAVLDKVGTIVYVNISWEKFAEENGAKPGTTGMGVNYFKVCDNAWDDLEYAKSTYQGIKEVLNGEKNNFTYEYPCRYKGKESWYRLNVSPLTGKRDYVVISHSDITRQKLIEEKFEENKEIYSALFEKNNSPILIINPETALIEGANPAALKFYGYSKKEIINMNINRINTLTDEEIRTKMSHAKSTKSRTFNFSHRLKDGRVRHVEVYSGPIVLKGKQLLYSIIHDETERKREFARAESLQQHRLDTKFPLEDKAELKSIYIPAMSVSGDFYQLYRLDDNKVVGIIGDVCGKGMTAALNVNAIKVLFSDGLLIDWEPIKILNYLNRQVIRHFEDDYIAVCCFLFDFSKKEVVIAGAGINQYMHKEASSSWSIETVKGPFLGMFEDSEFEQHIISFKEKDCFGFYTDGLDFIIDDLFESEKCLVLETQEKMKDYLSKTLFDVKKLYDDCTWLGVEIK
ncbi:PAS domain S-box protein [Oxobacter pfennigii]|nr:PAS domain S-box protein [Oxobacter pfennigii]